MKVIATISRSAGNDTVGDMWQETAIFNESQSISEVLFWADGDTYIDVVRAIDLDIRRMK